MVKRFLLSGMPLMQYLKRKMVEASRPQKYRGIIGKVSDKLGAKLDLGDGWAAFSRGDYQKALKEFSILAEEGWHDAQFNLGLMYDNGEGVPRDYQEALKWYSRSAEQGNAWAQYNLGLMYLQGKGVVRDDIQAYAWYNLSASQGLEGARDIRDSIHKQMTPSQIVEAQKLSHELYDRIHGNK